MNSSTLRASRLPISAVVSALVVAALLLLPDYAAGFGLSLSVEGTGTGSDEFAVGNKVPFTISMVLIQEEVLNATVTADLDGPNSFSRTFVGIPLGSSVGTDISTTFGPSTATADVKVVEASSDPDTTISGTVTHKGILTEFDAKFVGYGFGYKGLVANASITIDGTLSLPRTVAAGKYTLKITVDNGPGPARPRARPSS